MEMIQPEVKRIERDIYIAEILADHPDKAKLISEILMEFGVNCAGCGAAAFETLEQGVLGHGFSEADLQKLVIDLNRAVEGKLERKAAPQKEIRDFSLKLTDHALKKVQDIMKHEGKENATLRVGILSGGCSGYTYDMEFANKPGNGLKFKQGPVNIEVDRESLEFLHNTTIDFVDTLKESGFRFNNPNATKGCGCGKSFS